MSIGKTISNPLGIPRPLWQIFLLYPVVLPLVCSCLGRFPLLSWRDNRKTCIRFISINIIQHFTHFIKMSTTFSQARRQSLSLPLFASHLWYSLSISYTPFDRKCSLDFLWEHNCIRDSKSIFLKSGSSSRVLVSGRYFVLKNKK